MFAYNLLVTFHENQKGRSELEVRDLLGELGTSVEKLETCDVEGVFLIRVAGEAKVLVSQLKRLCHEDPVGFQYTHHWVPIERWTTSKKEEIRKNAVELGRSIGTDETWMMHLHKRHMPEHYDDLIAYLTEPLNRGTVDLFDPDRILAVEILGKSTGMSLLTRHELLDVNQVRNESEQGKV